MSVDLLARLRRCAMAPDSLLAQAADEIERLRALVLEARQAHCLSQHRRVGELIDAMVTQQEPKS